MKRLERARDYLGSWDALADRLLPGIEREMEAYEPFCTTHVDLLAYLLSFVTLADVMSVLLTCKTWYRVVYEKREIFWKRLVNVHGNLDTFRPVPVIPGDPLVVETLQQQVEWLYRRNWKHVRGADGTYVLRYNGSGRWLQISLGYVVLAAKCDWPFKEDSLRVELISNGVLETTPKQNTGRISIRSSNNTTFTGQALRVKSTQKFRPHGNGRWTFANGRVLEGRGVAWKGQPRWPNKKARIE